MAQTLTLSLRSQKQVQDAEGRNVWKEVIQPLTLPANQVAILICDMWDAHTQEGAAKRVDAMAPKMNKVVAAARAKGVHILHGPNDCMDFYIDHPARRRMREIPVWQPPSPLPHDEPAWPLPAESQQTDTPTLDRKHNRVPWTRQHVAIEIDPSRDGIAVSGSEIYSYMRHHGIKQYIIMGVHTNMCIMHRTFAIKQMVKWGVPIALVRDMTDAIYDPFKPPYISHDEGTRIIVGYIEKFWCPTVDSSELLNSK